MRIIKTFFNIIRMWYLYDVLNVNFHEEEECYGTKKGDKRKDSKNL